MLMKIFFWSWSPPSRSIFFKKSSFPRTRAWSGREATVTPLKLVFTAYCCYILFCYFLILMYLICLILFYRSTQWKNEPIANQQRNQRFLTCSPFPFSPLQRTVSCQQLKAGVWRAKRYTTAISLNPTLLSLLTWDSISPFFEMLHLPALKDKTCKIQFSIKQRTSSQTWVLRSLCKT